MKNAGNINTDGIEVNSSIIDSIKNYKQASILESNYLQITHTISDEMLTRAYIEIVDIVKYQMIQRLSDKLIEKYKDSFEEKLVPGGTNFSLRILTMSTSELKHIVDYIIRTIPESRINEIRKNK
jgi:hypothetical protein